MIIVMQNGASKHDIESVESEIKKMGYQIHPIYGIERTVIGAIGDERGKHRLRKLEAFPGVENVIPILKPYKLAGKELRREKSKVKITDDIVIGGKQIHVFAGPCSVESLDQICDTAMDVAKYGATILRGGAYKPRTSPYSFQGHAEEGLKMLDAARKKSGLPVATELMKESTVDIVESYADVIQIGTRNMQNFDLLKAVGQTKKPVLLKRGLANTISEWLMSAEYIMAQGNMDVILCERGIRTFETATRNTLDLSAVSVIRKESHLPIIIDPSHATGHWDYIEAMGLAAIAAGADGLMIEVHQNPCEAWSDGAQSLTPDNFARFMDKARKVAQAVGREIA